VKIQKKQHRLGSEGAGCGSFMCKCVNGEWGWYRCSYSSHEQDDLKAHIFRINQMNPGENKICHKQDSSKHQSPQDEFDLCYCNKFKGSITVI